jgi:hypothetical protein
MYLVVDREYWNCQEHRNPNMELNLYYWVDGKENSLLRQQLYREKVDI